MTRIGSTAGAGVCARRGLFHTPVWADAGYLSAELEYGYARTRAHRALAVVREFLDALISLPFGRDEAVRYGIIRDELEPSGHPIGDRDTMIAATALANGCVVVTDNVRHFSRVEGLQVENGT